ncbi:helix-turn-helix domain-containing protein [Paenibacillus koleovorans]|uniref:helix-turn-helix domain-containing protein n=1 Tax=Paenibacillus koleovorans TaxID=121608 RepID=UPI000FDC75E6|nr:helix-turn-helix domain-containing protein [Paenibacillus koleovorans]
MRNKGRSIVLKFLIPYLLILIVPVLIGLFNYYKTLSVIETETAKSNMNMLNQTRGVIDRRLEEVDKIARQIMLDPNLISFQYQDDPFEGSNTFRTIETRKSVLNYNLFNNFISSFYIYYPKSDLVITPTVISDSASFYRDMVRITGTSYEHWIAKFMNQYHTRTIEPTQPYVVEGKEREMIAYVQSLGFVSNVYATIVILIDNTEFVKLMSGLDISDGGWAYIADRQGKIVSSISTAKNQVEPIVIDSGYKSGTIFPSAASGNMMTTYTTSESNGWSYVVSQPAHIALEKVNYIRSTMLTILLLSLAAGFLFALLMAYRSSRPIRFLMNSIGSDVADSGKTGRKRDVYQLIQSGIFQLKSSHDALQQEMEKQRPMLRFALFERLLKGELPLSDDIPAIMERHGIRMEGRTFAVALLSLSDHNELLLKEDLLEMERKSLLVQELVSRLSDEVFPHTISGHQVALLFACRAEDVGACQVWVEQLLEQLQRDLQEARFSPSVGIGDVYTQLEDWSRSFHEAEQALDYKIRKSLEGVVRFSDLPQDSGSYYYPAEMELKLMNLTKAGNPSDLRKLFLELYTENFEKRHLSSAMIKLLLYDMKGSLAKLAEQLAIEDARLGSQLQAFFDRSDRGEDGMELFQTIQSMCLELCEVVDRRKKSHNDQLLAGILEMVQTQYPSPSFSLISVSEAFNISEIYVSHFIKEQTGMTFSEYVEQLRMDRAKKLLLDDRYTVKDIAEMVGYNSSNTFCRAFKRLNGISTTDFKRSV